MTEVEKMLYSPALRMKAGELAALRDLDPGIADCVLPRLIVPPLSERKREPQLVVLDNVPDVGAALARNWRDRPTLLDCTYLVDECGRAGIGVWLPRLFERARRAGVRVIPFATLRDLEGEEVRAFRSAVCSSDVLKFGIALSSGEMMDPSSARTINQVLVNLSLTPSDCAIIADFHDAEFSDPARAAGVIRSSLEWTQELGLWQRTIFQGTNYPERNPAEPGGLVVWPRGEWRAWRDAVKLDSSTAMQLMFGDYAADCAKIVFRGSGGIAIRHYRYATEDAWLVVRADKGGKDKETMLRVCRRIVDSPAFAGAHFSAADRFIWQTAGNAAGPGNATMWRRANVNHHVTRVVTDLAKVRAIAIARNLKRDDQNYQQALSFDA